MKFVKYLTAFSVFSVVVGVTLPASAINPKFQTFTDRTTWKNQVNIQESENFDSIKSDTAIGGTDFSIPQTGPPKLTLSSSVNSPQNVLIDAPNYRGNPNNAQFSNTILNTQLEQGETLKIKDETSSLTAIGFDYDVISGAVNRLEISSPAIGKTLTAPATQGFFGLATNQPFGSLKGEVTGSGKPVQLAIDNGSVGTSQPVPFEAEGTMGLVALSGYLFYRHRKKSKQALSQ